MFKLKKVFLLQIFFIFQVLSNETTFQSYKLCNDELGYCVPSTLCHNKTEFSDGSNILNSRFSLDLVDENAECHYLQTCCDPENIISIEESQARIEDRLNENNLQQCMQQCKTVDASNQKKLPLKINPYNHQPINGCGFRNVKGVGMEIQTPNVAQFGEFPWHLALKEKKDDSDYLYICGASLIHPQVALTSAHCVYNKHGTNLRIRAGEWDTQTINEPYPHEDYDVMQIVIHPDFNEKNLYNDIALLVLESRIKLSAHVNTICLPPQNLKFDNQNCFVSGWGKENFANESAYRVNLKKLELPIVPLKNCQDKLRKTKLGEKFKIDLSFMCAGGEKDVDTCVGDGGSALVCAIPGENDYFYQTGIVAWGIECGIEDVPGVYANVAKFREWIDIQMTNLDFGTASYTF